MDGQTHATIARGFLDYQYEVLGIAPFLASPDVTEICINRPGELYLERRGGWQRVEVPSLTYDRARQFCTAVVNETNTGQRITDVDPVVSLTFPTGQRAQFVLPPACEAGRVSITIRLPSRQSRSLDQYQADGFFEHILEGGPTIDAADEELLRLRAERRYAEFFRRAVLAKKNIVVAGATGSGKTTFMKSLVSHIPHGERLVSIEDARELFLDQPNVVHLLYSKGGQSTANVTAKSCMEACLRMKPDRIILAELRGDESFYFIRNCASGHPGSITSCHAGSVSQTWDQLALMVKASTEGAGLEFATIKRLLMLTIDIVVHISAHAGKRRITGIDFDPWRTLGVVPDSQASVTGATP
ncbi:P-type DNA transfer ATPase VirB11 [Luteibacter sp. 329MFSha]|uniref:P-type DNA transfer ATPase VirB11 n=1 Tax=Luteibacter sp. 329MFSha TaxID=1798239 RepID=UPI0008C65F05|nr:P-type DNA transfer ATPase VirB11 [Luteibacter sp. 329MFSha]SEW00232.1 type IV secretion system protein VirB11 [Luteibacter sp. 329MFSha]